MTVNDTGATGTNSVSVVGTSGPDTITQSSNTVVANGSAITLGSNVSSLTIDGSGGTGDTFTVTGMPTITPTVQGVADTAVTGTTGNDTIVLSPVGNTGKITAKLNGQVVGTYQPSGRMIIKGLAGDDDIQVAGSIAVPMWLYGGTGNDRLKGGDGHDVLLGEDGDELVVGGSGRDLLIGGRGADRLVGNTDDDVLIADLTIQTAPSALDAVMKEWTRTDRTYQQRVTNLMNGGGLNGAVVLNNTTVFSDADADVLTGTSGNDWYLFDSVRDRVTDLKDEAFVNDLTFIGS